MALDLEVSILRDQRSKSAVGFSLEARDSDSEMFCLGFAEDLQQKEAGLTVSDDRLKLQPSCGEEIQIVLKPSDAQDIKALFEDRSAAFRISPEGVLGQGFCINRTDVQERELVREKVASSGRA